MLIFEKIEMRKLREEKENQMETDEKKRKIKKWGEKMNREEERRNEEKRGK